MSTKETNLLDSYHIAKETGNRIGFLKQEFIPVAEALTKQGKLVKLNQGLYRLPKSKG